MYNDVTFNAVVRDIFDAQGNVIPSELGRGVYNEDSGDLLSICGPQFKPVQHMDILDPILSRLSEQGYDVQERSGTTRNALYDLAGKKGAWVSPKVTDNGAVMRADIILGDFIQPTGKTAYMTDGPDTNFFRISVLNSHNRKYAVRVNTSYLRVLCMNGMTQPYFQAGTYGKHTTHFNVDGLQAQITGAMNAMHDDADKFGMWATTRIDAAQAEDFLKRTIAKMPNKPNGEPHFSEPLVRKILSQFQREDQTLWGLYNAVTWWQSHSEMKTSANKLTATIGREQKVASMLRTPEWGELEHAI